MAITTVLVSTFDDLDVLPNEALPLIEGSRAEPEPVAPDQCEGPCFDPSAISEARLDPQVYDDAGLSVLYAGAGSEPQAAPSYSFEIAANGWSIDAGSPDECFVTYPDAPLAYALDAPPAVTTSDAMNAIHIIASRGSADELSTSMHTLRLFPSNDEALEHMRSLQNLVDGCRRYELGESWNALVTPAPALDLPDSVSAIGWVEVDAFEWRYYSIDLLRGNVVARIRLSTDNGITEQQFRTLVEQAAADMATWPLDEN
ncbi:MAG: hypothetical protein C0444_02645 [Microbacterium sp.]|nr:hypothetical protein [Microbacterium sp.]MBA4346387.1 hypothetical protein [Microbacterium sp.]